MLFTYLTHFEHDLDLCRTALVRPQFTPSTDLIFGSPHMATISMKKIFFSEERWVPKLWVLSSGLPPNESGFALARDVNRRLAKRTEPYFFLRSAPQAIVGARTMTRRRPLPTTRFAGERSEIAPFPAYQQSAGSTC